MGTVGSMKSEILTVWPFAVRACPALHRDDPMIPLLKVSFWCFVTYRTNQPPERATQTAVGRAVCRSAHLRRAAMLCPGPCAFLPGMPHSRLRELPVSPSLAVLRPSPPGRTETSPQSGVSSLTSRVPHVTLFYGHWFMHIWRASSGCHIHWLNKSIVYFSIPSEYHNVFHLILAQVVCVE